MSESVEQIVQRQVRGAIRDGMSLGMSMAADMLKAQKPEVSLSNQTWDSAIAVINLLNSKFQAERDDK